MNDYQQEIDEFVHQLDEILFHYVADYADQRIPIDLASVLPAADADLNIYANTLIPTDLIVEKSEAGRKDLASHKETLRDQHKGKPELIALMMLCIACLRRNPEDKALPATLFFRIMDEQTDVILNNVDERFLISILRTYVEYARDDEERYLGYAGFVYGALIRAYETERYLSDLPLDNEIFDLPPPGPPEPRPVTWIKFGHDDALSSIHSYLVLATKDTESPVAKTALLLAARIKNNNSLFKRISMGMMEKKQRYQRNLYSWPYGRPFSIRGKTKNPFEK